MCCLYDTTNSESDAKNTKLNLTWIFISVDWNCSANLFTIWHELHRIYHIWLCSIHFAQRINFAERGQKRRSNIELNWMPNSRWFSDAKQRRNRRKNWKKKHQSFALLDKQKFSKVNYIYVCENASQYCTWKWKYAKESGEFAKFISPLCPNVFPYFVFLFWLCFFFSESFLESLTQKKTVKIRMNAKKTSMNKQMLYILVHDTRDTQTHKYTHKQLKLPWKCTEKHSQ